MSAERLDGTAYIDFTEPKMSDGWNSHKDFKEPKMSDKMEEPTAALLFTPRGCM